MKARLFGIAAIALSVSVLAAESPYQGEESRDIKALSEQEIEGYLNGKGMGLAKAAELNQYPGPRHVLDMADDLALSKEQISQTQTLFDDMQEEASLLGKQLVDKERDLDQQFSNASIDSEKLKALLSDIGALQAKIRYAHLSAHLKQKSLLDEHQTKMYDQLRGYGASHGVEHNHSH